MVDTPEPVFIKVLLLLKSRHLDINTVLLSTRMYIFRIVKHCFTACLKTSQS